MQNQLNDLDTRGKFTIVSLGLGEQWSAASGDLTLKLSPSTTGGHLWGQFDFGIVSGIMRCDAPPTNTGDLCNFSWRGTESGEGEMTYSEHNVGKITFLGGGRIRGTIAADLFQVTEFTGVHDQVTPKTAVWVKHVKVWKEQWRGINFRTYEAARVGRWGKWYEGSDYTEPPAESDTTDGEGFDGESEFSNDDYENAAF
jgi:hypothetical protein